MNKLTPKTKQKLCGLLTIIIGIRFIFVMPDECGWGILLAIAGIYFLLTKKQYIDFD